MLRLLLFIILFLIVYYLLTFFVKVIFSPGKKSHREEKPEELVQDPYCQTYIPIRSALRRRVGGRDYYFCKRECLERFLQQKE